MTKEFVSQPTLEEENVRLQQELARARATIVALQEQVRSMTIQEQAMAALFHGATPTMAGRVAHQRVLASRRDEREG